MGTEVRRRTPARTHTRTGKSIRTHAAAAGCGVAVLSGLARGVDCAALQAAGFVLHELAHPQRGPGGVMLQADGLYRRA